MSELYDLMTPNLAEHDEDAETDAAIYARTSSTSREFGYSIDEQVRQCSKRCQMLDWDVTYVFCDEAKSGKDTDRPMFQEMLSSAKDGGFDVLVFWKLDRFSRSIMHAVQLERKFRDWGVALHSVTEQIDTTSPAGRFNFRNIANAAEFERELIKQRTKMGHMARAMEYKWPNGTPPLGYRKKDDGKLEIDEKEATLVREIFETYVDVKSMPTVATVLNERGDRTNRGDEWTPRAVGAVLRNPLYVGTYEIGETNEHVEEYRIVSQKLFNEATAVRTRFTQAKSTSRNTMPTNRKKTRVERINDDYQTYRSGY